MGVDIYVAPLNDRECIGCGWHAARELQDIFGPFPFILDSEVVDTLRGMESHLAEPLIDAIGRYGRVMVTAGW